MSISTIIVKRRTDFAENYPEAILAACKETIFLYGVTTFGHAACQPPPPNFRLQEKSGHHAVEEYRSDYHTVVFAIM